MAKKSFACKVVTPVAALVSDEMTYASIPAWDGLMGFLPGRAPILTRLGIGELRLDYADSSKGKGGTRAYLVEGGFAKMAGDQLTILAERAIPAEELTPQQAAEEMRKAQAMTVSGTGAEARAQQDRKNAALQRARAMQQLVSGGKGI